MVRSSTSFFFILAFSTSTIAIDKFDPLEVLPNDAVIYLTVNFITPKDVCKLRKVNRHWNFLMSSDAIWQMLYFKIWRKTQKDDNSPSWMDNFKQQALIPRLSKFLAYSYDAMESLLKQRFRNFDTYCNLVPSIVNHKESSMSHDELNNYFDNITTDLDNQKTQVIATFFSSDLNNFLPAIEAKLKKALEKDIIVIVPCGNDAQPESDIWQGNNVHKLYPNVIWVGSHDEQNNINDFSNYGPLVDIFAPCKYPTISSKGTSPAMIWVFEAVSYLRGLRPELNAEKIRMLLIDSADDHNGNKILNLEKAKKRVLK